MSLKRILFLGLLTVMAAGLVFAAGGSQASGGSANSLEIWSIQTTGKGPGIFERAVARFTADNPTIKANLTMIVNDAYKQKIAVALASGQTPDAFLSWSGGPMYEYAKNGSIVDLTSYMNANNYKDKFLDAAIAQATYQGKIWGLPMQNVSVCTVFYNKELFAKYNIAVPTTIRELEAACDTLKKNGITPFSLANKTQWTGSMYFMFLATRRGGTQPFINAVDGSGTFLDPAFIYAGEKLQEWVNKGYFNTGFNGLDEDSGQARQILYRGEAAMHIMGSWFNSSALTESPEFAAKMGIFKFPRDEQGSGNPNTVIGTVGDNFYHVASSSKNQAKAFELISHLIDDNGIADALDDGRIPPVKGVKLSDPILAELFGQVQAAPDIQLWYDQSLSPEVADVHKVTSQEIFGGTLSPRAAAQQLQDAQAAYLKKK
ncbi:extracellular solute-binding protein [Leadbettera azotonutricia]|uniref:Extracellular solute-binding protein, family 1 n=1 Tax=Leadbettera azotonutricia (strain ATCC BAA-888 / DSM 13862 / ZAS-9) TaxID=545695 RepID=F5Y969_LEAAZ|nr:extracellular solute-binding protein [Leadbettera azotonutricia]AEF81596.1 extracellular solute-binding protein, family 1 [Leadbettera azotonutricia ZAS-9]